MPAVVGGERSPREARMEQKIVVHLKGGVIHKGVTQDFEPSRASFHLLPAEGGGVPMRFDLDDLKAMFWVKDYLGNRDFVARRAFPASEPAQRKAVLTFEDGESIWGTVAEEDEAWRGFFFRPADERDNNIRIFVVRSSVKEVRWVP
jgi:hypothetical protein